MEAGAINRLAKKYPDHVPYEENPCQIEATVPLKRDDNENSKVVGRREDIQIRFHYKYKCTNTEPERQEYPDGETRSEAH